jgi:hypothetical protein
MKTITHWIPVTFCAFISLMPLCSVIPLRVWNSYAPISTVPPTMRGTHKHIARKPRMPNSGGVALEIDPRQAAGTERTRPDTGDAIGDRDAGEVGAVIERRVLARKNHSLFLFRPATIRS